MSVCRVPPPDTPYPDVEALLPGELECTWNLGPA